MGTLEPVRTSLGEPLIKFSEISPVVYFHIDHSLELHPVFISGVCGAVQFNHTQVSPVCCRSDEWIVRRGSQAEGRRLPRVLQK